MPIVNRNVYKKWSIICLIVSLILIFTGKVYSQDDAESYYDKGTDFLRKGELDNAISSLESAITSITQDGITESEKELLAEIYNNRGLAYFNKDDYTNAIKDYVNALIYNSTDTKILNNLGLAYYVQGDYDNAILWYEKAQGCITEEEPLHADLYNNMGVCYANKTPPDYVKAKEAYNNAIRISSEATWGEDVELTVEDASANYTEAYYNRGNLYYNEKDYDAAIADYSVTIDFYENSKSEESNILENACYNRGLCYYNKGLYSDAINDYTKTIQLNPGYIWAHYAKGFAHYMLYQDTDAIAEYQNVLDSGDEEVGPYALFGMGLVNVRQKDTFDQGMEYLEQSCDTGQCTIACEALEQGLYADTGTVLDFELPQ